MAGPADSRKPDAGISHNGKSTGLCTCPAKHGPRTLVSRPSVPSERAPLAIKGHERLARKAILNELKDEGIIEQGKRQSFVSVGDLPEIVALKILG